MDMLVVEHIYRQCGPSTIRVDNEKGILWTAAQRVHLCQDCPASFCFCESLKLHISLSGDGTNIGKHLHVINFHIH